MRFVCLNWNEWLREEGLMRHVPWMQWYGRFGGWFGFDELVLEGQPFGGDSHFFPVHSNGLDCVTKLDDLISHAHCFGRLALDDGLQEGSFGVELDIRQSAHFKQ